MDVIYRPIGVIHSPFHDLAGMPIQPASESSGPGTVEVYAEFAPGLKDLEGFSHLLLITHLHAVKEARLRVTPFLDDEPHGVFATRAPTRPNPIGLSVVRLAGVRGNCLDVDGLDLLDGTPLLDIKPYVPEFDQPVEVRIGWLEAARGRARSTKSDRRFS
ncbi:MAG: tRNA (N6-threonylcarbamoyladenosine(37)-N6)-methyltransferase TrmO [Anaerolineales bacterium]|nr:tRNA (N6-threonylcarbamoyladenosine(37)-N6)-methyltransferase TrmO [Anaerolineales bacterium]